MFTKEKFGEYLWSVIVPTIVAFMFSLVSTYYNGTSTITIGQSARVSDKFITPINISAYKEIDKLKITFPIKLNEKQISSNVPLYVKSVDNNIGVDNSSTFELTAVSENSSVQLLISTREVINDKNIKINKNGNNISVNYDSEISNPAQEQLINIIITTVMFFLVLNFVTWLQNKRSDRERLKMEELIDRYANNIEAKARDMNELREDFIRSKNNNAKVRVLLQAKLNDHKKELSFWRNTIRKILYEIPDGDKKAEKLIGTVTSSLGTYSTNEKNEHDFEALKVAAALLRDSEEES